MKFLHSKLIWSLVVSSIALGASAQSVKIGIVDMEKVFNAFWKTKQAQASLKDLEANYNKSGASMLDDYKKLNEDYKKFAESASDPAISGDEKEKRKKQAEQKLREIQEYQTDIQRFKESSNANLTESMKRNRDNLVRDIREKVNELARKAGYTQVFNSSGEAAGVPVLLFNSGSNDMTDDVIAALNVGAPTNIPADKPAEAKPAPGAAATPGKGASDPKKDKAK